MNEVVGKGDITAKIIADSISGRGKRITTFQLKYPRFIHSEFMTHRVFSRNASSSRAIPVKKMIESIKSNPAMPIHWGANKAGMQADEEVDEKLINQSKVAWKSAANTAATYAEGMMSEQGLHKQIVNRILEPFQFIHVVVTATEWDNFYALRYHPAAQPEIKELARVMMVASSTSIPNKLKSDEWHLPYVDEYDDIVTAIKCSVARCARVSYVKHDQTKPSIDEDIDLYNALVTRPYVMKNGLVMAADDPIHASPAEHQATPMDDFRILDSIPRNMLPKGVTHVDTYGEYWSANFKGWVQYRQKL